jgi:uncharacterized protein (TIGR02246 family)
MTGQRTISLQQTLLAAAALTAIMGAPGCSTLPHPDLPLAQKHSWETSFNRGDSAAIAALYAPDAELVMSGAAPIHGRDAIRAAVDDMLKSGVKVQIQSGRAEVAGNLAYFYGSYQVLSKQSVVERGTYLEVWRYADNQWHIEYDVNATGVPIARNL